MSPIKKITYFENRKRVKKLEDFKVNVQQYWRFARGRHNLLSFETIDNSVKLRAILNREMFSARDTIRAAGVSTQYVITDNAMGTRFTHDVIAGMFDYGGGVERIVDVIDRAIGVYRQDFKKYEVRTFNPFFWIGRIADLIADELFLLIGRFGFNEENLRGSTFGRIANGLINFAAQVATIVGTLKLFEVI